jgi:ATP synthase protein I
MRVKLHVFPKLLKTRDLLIWNGLALERWFGGGGKLVNFFTMIGILVNEGPGGPRFAADSGMMANNRRGFSLARSARSLQETVSRSGAAATASYTLVGAILLLGMVGYWVDQWRDSSPWFLLAGLLAGMVVGFYELIKIARHR